MEKIKYKSYIQIWEGVYMTSNKVNNCDLPKGCYKCPFNGLVNHFGQFRLICTDMQDNCPLGKIELKE